VDTTTEADQNPITDETVSRLSRALDYKRYAKKAAIIAAVVVPVAIVIAMALSSNNEETEVEPETPEL
jgi:hypothetical protein